MSRIGVRCWREVRFSLATLATAASCLIAGWVDVRPAGGQVSSAESADVDRGSERTRRAETDRAFQTVDEEGRATVARPYFRLGSDWLLYLPDGRIVKRAADQLVDSARPYRPFSAKEAAKRLEAEFPGMRIRVSRDYVFVSNTSELFAEVTRRVLGTMLPGIRKYARRLDLEIRAPEFPLVVVMFRTRREFDAYQRMRPEVLAYYSPWSNRIVLHEESPLDRVDPDLATKQTISTIAHEGAHQILHNIGVQQRLSRWPMWIAEGMAEYLAPTRLGRRLSWKGAGSVNDLRMLELEFYVKAKAFDAAPGEMVQHTVQGASLTSTGYATSWALTHYLATRKKPAFRSFLRELTELGPMQSVGKPDGQGLVHAQLDLFRRHFSQSAEELETALVDYLQDLPYTDPFASSPHVVALVRLQRGSDRGWKANIFHSRVQAERWCSQFLKTLDGDIERQVELITVPNRSAAQQLIRRYASKSKSESKRSRSR